MFLVFLSCSNLFFLNNRYHPQCATSASSASSSASSSPKSSPTRLSCIHCKGMHDTFFKTEDVKRLHNDAKTHFERQTVELPSKKRSKSFSLRILSFSLSLSLARLVRRFTCCSPLGKQKQQNRRALPGILLPRGVNICWSD